MVPNRIVLIVCTTHTRYDDVRTLTVRPVWIEEEEEEEEEEVRL